MIRHVSGAALALALSLSAASAQIAVSANDNKAVLVDGVNTVPANPAADTVTIIDIGATPPKVIAEIKAPASVVGPPSSVAVTRDESLAIVTAATKVDPADPKKTAPDNKVSLIDLKANPPAVVATVEAGAGAAGVAISPAGNLVLVANRSEGTVSVFTLSGKTLTHTGKVQLGAATSGPSGIAFTPDGKSALVTRDGDNRISVLTVDGNKVEHSKRDMYAGLRPYPIDITANGRFAMVGNIGIGQGDLDTASLIDLTVNPPHVIDTITVGQTPEGLKISPDGRHAAVVLQHGTNKPKSSPFFNAKGLVILLAIDGKKLTKVTEAPIGAWCQGAAWSRDGRKLLVQCMVENEVMAFNFDGAKLTPAGGVKVGGGPAGIGTAQ
jgi:DNA-binding beta-propeller fold protein YncE